MREEFRSNILHKYTNMRAAMEGAGRNGDWYRNRYPYLIPFSQE